MCMHCLLFILLKTAVTLQLSKISSKGEHILSLGLLERNGVSDKQKGHLKESKYTKMKYLLLNLNLLLKFTLLK